MLQSVKDITKGLPTWVKIFSALTPLIVGLASPVSNIIIESMRTRVEIRRIEVAAPVTAGNNKSVNEKITEGVSIEGASLHANTVMEAK